MEPFTIKDRFIGRTPATHDPARARVFVDAEWDGERLSLTGTVIERGFRTARSTGQVTDDVRSISPRLADLWDRWHLNDMKAGCSHQEARYRDDPDQRPTWRNGYVGSTGDTMGVTSAGCNECGYVYGTSWNTEPVPPMVLTEIRAILDAGSDQPPRLTFPEWDAETDLYSLSDCKHWDKPGTECAGPRVGITADGVILCERHYNQTGA